MSWYGKQSAGDKFLITFWAVFITIAAIAMGVAYVTGWRP